MQWIWVICYAIRFIFFSFARSLVVWVYFAFNGGTFWRRLLRSMRVFVYFWTLASDWSNLFSPFLRSVDVVFASRAPLSSIPPLRFFSPLWFDFVVMYITPIYSFSLSWLMIPCYFMISVGAWPSDGRKCKVFKFFRNSNIRKYERECDFQSREERD